MTKRAYKLQEHVAHSANVSCLNIGKKDCRLFVTGGDDCKVNLWAIGKSTSLMSLGGHTSPIESVAFNSSEVLVLAGASSGVTKIWDLEEAKMVRTLTGHRSNCSAVEFHPFGEFFASGSMDADLKIWDIRKKGCIHTYKGHTQGISTIKFTPDGRWVVSGGFDNVVKVWDLTAGKLLHNFNFHEGPIFSLDFHPLEFLLATGSDDRTVKFWDLETFELIGSTRYEHVTQDCFQTNLIGIGKRKATGVRVIKFHPDGRTLFSGFDNDLKVYSWEPVICHDAMDMEWSTLGDLCIHEGKLFGCSHYQNYVAVGVSDISLVEPYRGGTTPVQNDIQEQKYNHKLQRSADKVQSDVRTSSLRFERSDDETKGIKNIYVDTACGKPVAPKKVEPLPSPKGVSQLDAKHISDQPNKQSPTVGDFQRVVPPSDRKDNNDQPVKKQSPIIGVHPKCNETVVNTSLVVPSIVPRDTSDGNDLVNSRKESISFSKTKRGMLLKPAHTRKPSNSTNDIERLQSAVEYESSGNRRNRFDSPVDPNIQTKTVLEDGPGGPCGENHSSIKSLEKCEKILSPQMSSDQETCNNFVDCIRDVNPMKFVKVAVIPGRTRTLVERFERREISKSNENEATNLLTPVISAMDKVPSTQVDFERRDISNCYEQATNLSAPVISTMDKAPSTQVNFERREISKNHEEATNLSTFLISALDKTSSVPANFERRETSEHSKEKATNISTFVTPEMEESPTMLKNEEPQIPGRDSTSVNDSDATEDLMRTHDVFLSTLRSRLTKLQVVRHFWERNDIKGAINAIRKLPDHSVQADVISVFMEKRDILKLDLFSSLLPVLVGLLDSKIERHVTLSLEFLVKFIAVFGPVIRSTISARRAVGVDLQAEQRLQCCNQCSVQLQKIQKVLPALVRKGGVVARGALQLSLVLQE